MKSPSPFFPASFLYLLTNSLVNIKSQYTFSSNWTRRRPPSHLQNSIFKFVMIAQEHQIKNAFWVYLALFEPCHSLLFQRPLLHYWIKNNPADLGGASWRDPPLVYLINVITVTFEFFRCAVAVCVINCIRKNGGGNESTLLFGDRISPLLKESFIKIQW
jgi:hypothetical protein